MTARVKDILRNLNTAAPFSLAEPWDNVGLLVGNPDQEVTAILAGLDPTLSLIEEAVATGANTVITHHPVIFKPLAAIDTSTPEGRLLEQALTHRIAIIGCHTNFDNAEAGVSAILAERLGLDNHAPLIPMSPSSAPGCGTGRIGSYRTPLPSGDFSRRVLDILGLDTLRMAGQLPAEIMTVAVCGGSGSEFAVQARARGAEVYLSAEIKHSTAIWAVENNFCIIDGTHYATEKPAVAYLVKMLQEICIHEHWNIPVTETTNEYHPFVSIAKNNPR